MNSKLIFAMLPIALGANAACVTDPPEIGDIGPGSGLVCQELTQRYPGAALAVDGRSIHSPTEVGVTASVDGRPILLAYRLTGFTWSLDDAGNHAADAAARPTRLSLGH
jgi:hypothetical protein